MNNAESLCFQGFSAFLYSLAIAIGTAHGIYPKGFVPKLKLDLLTEIRNTVDIPLVLHDMATKPIQVVVILSMMM